MPLTLQRNTNQSTHVIEIEKANAHSKSKKQQETIHQVIEINKQTHTGSNFDPSNDNMLLTNNDTDPIPLPVQRNKNSTPTS